MKKGFSLILFCAMALTYQSSIAQCTIVAGTTDGFTPGSLPCITQGQVYGQAVQVHVPATVTAGAYTVNVDSVLLRSVTGMPAGISVSGVPATGIIHGGGNGCLWYSGTTNATVGSYPLTFNVTIWADYMGVVSTGPVDTTLAAGGYNFSLSVCQAAVAPVAGFAANPMSGCGSVTVELADTSTNTPTGWSWSFPGGTPSSSTAHFPPGIVYSSPGTYSIKLVVSNSGGSDSITKTNYITVYPVPSVTVNTTPATSNVATDGTATAVPSGGTPSYTYAWSNSANTPIDSNLLYGTYMVTVTDAHNCTASSSGIVNFDAANTPPAAAFSASQVSGCGSLTALFTDNSTNFPTSWNWSFPGATVTSSTLQSPAVTYSSPGSYNVKLVVANSYGSDSLTKTAYIHVYPNPSVTVTTTPASTGTSANGTATASVSGGTSPFTYVWSNAATTAAITGLVHGEYVVTVTDSSNCVVVDSGLVTFNTGIGQISDTKQVKIYPDPAKDILNLDWTTQSEATVSILDMNGKLVKTIFVNGTLANSVDIHELAAGTYIVSIMDKQTGEVQSTRFTKF